MPVDLPLLLRGGIFVALLLVVSITDIRSRTIPNSVCAAIAVLSLIPFNPLNLLGLLPAVLFLLPAIFCGGMGGGDIKLMAACGIYLGLSRSLAASMIGLSLLLVFYLIKTITAKRHGIKRQLAFPLAPFLSFGCIAALIFNIGG